MWIDCSLKEGFGRGTTVILGSQNLGGLTRIYKLLCIYNLVKKYGHGYISRCRNVSKVQLRDKN